MKNGKASKLELAPRRRQPESQIIHRGHGLRRSSAAAHDLFELAPVASVHLGLDGVVRDVNHAGARQLGFARNELIGQCFRALVAASEHERFQSFMQRTSDQGTSERGEFVLLRAGTSPYAAELVASRLGRAQPSVLIAFEDVTERKAHDDAVARAEQALREADRRKNEFLALLSHELRNPLTPLANCLFVLSHAEPGSQRAQAARAIMQRQIEQLARLTEDLLDVTRIARGKLRLRWQRVDLRALLENALEDHGADFEACGIGLQVALEAGPHWVLADPARLTQAVSNLLGNARKFTPPGGRVAVGLSRHVRHVALRVCDNGTGIPAEALPWVFEPFAQASQTLDRSQGGLGLGLWLVKGLVELHGGTVSAASDGPGRGAQLCVWLPLDDADRPLLDDIAVPHAATVADPRVGGKPPRGA